MKFNIRPCIKYFDVSVEIENIKVDLGLMGESERSALALILRSAADDLCSDDVPYDSLVSAYERYRFLRAGFGDMGPEVDMHNAFVDGGEVMDRAIDAALTAAQSGDKS